MIMDDFFEVFKDLISGNDGEIDSAFVDDEVFTNVTDLNTDVIWNEENNNLFSQENSGSENIAMKGKKYGECHYCECRYYIPKPGTTECICGHSKHSHIGM